MKRRNENIKGVRRARAVVLAAVMAAGMIGGFVKMAGALSITGIDPEKGPVEGGQVVTITGTDFSQDTKWKQVSGGGWHTCALETGGRVYCWGNNGNGQLGDNTTVYRPTPVAVSTVDGNGAMNGKTITQITTSRFHTCALDTGGQVYCWGSNDNGQLGDNSTTDRWTPVAVNTTAGTGAMNGKIIKQIIAGDSHTCALDIAGQVYCWGNNVYGQLGDNTTTSRWTPIAVNTIVGTGAMNGKTIVQISAGNAHSCALDAAGQVYCWGYNYYGQLGDNTTASSWTPVAVNTIAGTGAMDGKVITQITAGETHTCALDTAGQVYCWGNNAYGRLGDNTVTQRNTPVAVNTTAGTGVMNGKIVIQITASEQYTCALDVAGRIYCWGADEYGQLGDGATTHSRWTPVAVDTSSLPPATYTVVMDAGGAPAPCEDVVVASDGLSLTCTTTAHSAGVVDITVNNGILAQTLVRSYEYVRDIGGGSLIDKLLSPDTGMSALVLLIITGEVVFVVTGIAVFFKMREA